MVEIKKRILTTLGCILVVTTAVAQTSNLSLTERQLRQLAIRSERVAAQIALADSLYTAAPNDSLDVVLHELHRQAESIAEAIGRLEAKQIEAQQPAHPTEPQEVVPQKDVVAEGLAPVFNTALRRYTMNEAEIESAFVDYRTHYAEAQKCAAAYDEATSLAQATEAHDGFQRANEALLASATTIADRSYNLFESKTKALIWFADSLGMAEEKAYFHEQNNQIEHAFMEELRGKCTDLDVAMYPYRKAALMALEVKLTRRMCGTERADSLVAIMSQIKPEDALFAPLPELKWSKAKFGEVAIHKQNKYSSVSAIPRIKIPSEGEIYSILLGYYASLPSINTFRKAAPLYTERRADGRTYVYAGLYPTAKSAQEGLATLRKAGFKQPTLVMWQNGLRRDDFVDRSAPAAPKAAMYKVEIRGANYGLSEAVSGAIKANAPRKEISKFTTEVGAIVYTVGIFTKEAEAEALAKAIREAGDNTISIRVTKM